MRTDDVALKAFNEQVIREFRESGGKLSGIFENLDVLLLTTTGAKSGLPRLTALLYLIIDGSMLIVGSRSGAPKDPAWVHNLRATAEAHVELGTGSFEATAREALGDERDELYGKLASLQPLFAVYQTRTTRTIPVFELHRRK